MTKPTYKQKNKAVFVRFDDVTMERLTQIGIEKRWSLASVVAYCVEQQLDIPYNPTIIRK